MKLRITEDSVRIRFTKLDLEVLKTTGSIEQCLAFPGTGKMLCYGISATDSGDESLVWDEGKLEIFIQRNTISKWIESEDVGIYFQKTLEGGSLLSVTLEKDFRCLHSGQKENESKYFPNPKTAC